MFSKQSQPTPKVSTSWQRAPFKQIHPQPSHGKQESVKCLQCELSFPTVFHMSFSCDCGQQKVSKKSILAKISIQICHGCKESLNSKNSPKSSCCHSPVIKRIQLQRDDPKALAPEQKAQIKHLLGFRIIVDNLLYIIGVPRRFADEQLLKSDKLCGLFGSPKRIVINHNPKDDCG